ncbi:MAG TPA: tetratricopeptide repeat protein [Haliangium sp.]|nr:tetratricopeptide repeat protein [Haliangium sp.]
MRLPLIPLSLLVVMGGSVIRLAPGHAAPAEQLAEAREAVRLGRYDEAIPALTYLLYPDARLSVRADLVEAHVLLGVSHFEKGNGADARRELDEALFLDDSVALDPLLFSEEAIAFFEERKQIFRERARREEETHKLAEERARLHGILENMIVIERKPYYINFVPFGAGQFQNGHDGKGIFFFVSQTVIGGTSAGLWVWQVGKYGYNGTVPAEEVETVRVVQQVQIATGVACLGLMVAGIIDSLIHYESTTRRPADESLIPADLKPRERGNESSWKLSPAPKGAGAVITWEF